jgi:hypothetical protein
MPDRKVILEILNAEVMDATSALDEAKSGSEKAHLDARAALQKAVERHCGFNMFGRVPDELRE